MRIPTDAYVSGSSARFPEKVLYVSIVPPDTRPISADSLTNGKLSEKSANMFVRVTFCDRSYGPPLKVKAPSLTRTAPLACESYVSFPAPSARPKKPTDLPATARHADVFTLMPFTAMSSLPDVASMLVVGRSRRRYVSDTDGVA